MVSLQEISYQTRRRSRSAADIPVFIGRMLQYLCIAGLKQGTVIRLAFGDKTFLMRINPTGPREGSRGIFVFRERYEPLLNCGSGLLKTGDVALDLGANQGIYCCAFGAVVGPSGRVIAVEPIPRQVERLQANIALNGFRQCEVLQKAISDRVGTTTLGLGSGDVLASIVAEDKSKSIEVQTTTVDQIVRDHSLHRVDFIKLDIEGAEMLALRGAENTLREFRPTLALEAADPMLFSAMRSLIGEIGYRTFSLASSNVMKEITELVGFEDNVIAIARSDLLETV